MKNTTYFLWYLPHHLSKILKNTNFSPDFFNQDLLFCECMINPKGIYYFFFLFFIYYPHPGHLLLFKSFCILPNPQHVNKKINKRIPNEPIQECLSLKHFQSGRLLKIVFFKNTAFQNVTVFILNGYTNLWVLVAQDLQIQYCHKSYELRWD